MVLAIRTTYGQNTGVWGGNVIGKVGSCSWNYGAIRNPANVEMVWDCPFFRFVGRIGGESGGYGPQSGKLTSYMEGKWITDIIA